MSEHRRLAELAERHLWGHFSVLKNDIDGTRVIERGQGCHVWDAEGNLLATNDDMPYRMWETDSALYYQATEDGTFYAEVLEFSDWHDDYAAANAE